MSVGDRLREQRERAKLSQGQVGRYEGVTPQYISDLERGRNSPPAWDLLARLAKRYHCTTDYLLGRSEHPNGYAPEAPVSSEGREAVSLIDSLPPERRAAAVHLLRSIIEFAEVGVPLPDSGEMGEQPLPEPVVARRGGGVTNRRFAELGPQQFVSNANDAGAGTPGGEDEGEPYDSARLARLLALLEKMLSPRDYAYVVELVNAGLPLTEADIERLLQSPRKDALQKRLDLLGDEDAV